MIINETELKRIYWESIASRESGHREDCPSPDALLSFFDPKARRKKKYGVVDHISHCPECLREFSFLAELQRHEAEFLGNISPLAESEPRQGSGSGPSRLRAAWGLSGVFAGVVLALASLVVIVINRGTDEGIRGMRSALTTLRPVGIQSVAEPLIFEWQGAGDIDSYVVEVFDASLLRLWSSPRTPATRIQVPRAGPPPLTIDQTYFWTVSGYSGDVKVVESALVEFRLTGPQRRN